MIRYAVSDIHGMGTPFLKLLDHVDPDPEELIILGDLCNRGLESWEVFEECAQLVDEGAKIVQGNHDHWFRAWNEGSMSTQTFFDPQIGGITTCKSLELASEKLGVDHIQNTVDKVCDAMIPYFEDDDYIFVHAGIDPYIHEMFQQKPEVLMMGCERWRNPRVAHSFTQTIVFGHTPTPMIHRDIQEDDARVWYSRKARKMAIDTGAGFYMRLTMVDLQEGIAYAYDLPSKEIIEYQFMRRRR